jgi:hypothetical protein
MRRSAGDLEPNPGPQPHPAMGTIHFGYTDINSAITKSALIHNLISSFSLDILALSETRFLHNMPNAIRIILLLLGFPSVIVHRQPYAKHSSESGLAIVHRSHIVV